MCLFPPFALARVRSTRRETFASLWLRNGRTVIVDNRRGSPMARAEIMYSARGGTARSLCVWTAASGNGYKRSRRTVSRGLSLMFLRTDAFVLDRRLHRTLSRTTKCKVARMRRAFSSDRRGSPAKYFHRVCTHVRGKKWESCYTSTLVLSSSPN